MPKKPEQTEADDKALAADIKTSVYALRALIAKADKCGISCDFQIRKDQKAGWVVAQCEIRKKF